MTDEELEKHSPWIPWRKSVLVTVSGMGQRICCRYCIGRNGLKAWDLYAVGFKTEEEFQEHLEEFHPKQR